MSDQEDELLKLLNDFVHAPASQHALKKLSKRASFGISVGTRNFTFKESQIHLGLLEPRDFDLKTTPIALRHIAGLKNESPKDVANIGVEIVKSLAHPDPERKSSLKIHGSLFSLIKNGYFAVASSGGKDFFKFLATKGLGNMRKIQEKIRGLMK